MKRINFSQLLEVLKNNNFNLYYRSNSKSRYFKDRTNIVIDSESINYKHGKITEQGTNDIYIFDNNFIALKDYNNYKMIEISLTD
jgi:hypothetical protein